MYTILPESEGASIGITVSGKLSTEEERELVKKADSTVAEHGKLNILVELHEFKGATAQAMVTDLKWLAKNLKNISRLAIVADSKILGWLVELDAVFARLMNIEEKHFTRQEIDDAWTWLKRPAG